MVYASTSENDFKSKLNVITSTAFEIYNIIIKTCKYSASERKALTKKITFYPFCDLIKSIRCYICKKDGHKAENCKYKNKNKNNEDDEEKPQSNYKIILGWMKNFKEIISSIDERDEISNVKDEENGISIWKPIIDKKYKINYPLTLIINDEIIEKKYGVENNGK
ncbi:hypothetical protein U3516DRAFT_779918 [Neocallimastix sp. 'constans']